MEPLPHQRRAIDKCLASWRLESQQQQQRRSEEANSSDNVRRQNRRRSRVGDQDQQQEEQTHSPLFRGGFLLLHQMGLGRRATAIRCAFEMALETAQQQLNLHNAGKSATSTTSATPSPMIVLITCPTSLHVSRWQAEIERVFPSLEQQQQLQQEQGHSGGVSIVCTVDVIDITRIVTPPPAEAKTRRQAAQKAAVTAAANRQKRYAAAAGGISGLADDDEEDDDQDFAFPMLPADGVSDEDERDENAFMFDFEEPNEKVVLGMQIVHENEAGDAGSSPDPLGSHEARLAHYNDEMHRRIAETVVGAAASTATNDQQEEQQQCNHKEQRIQFVIAPYSRTELTATALKRYGLCPMSLVIVDEAHLVCDASTENRTPKYERDLHEQQQQHKNSKNSRLLPWLRTRIYRQLHRILLCQEDEEEGHRVAQARLLLSGAATVSCSVADIGAMLSLAGVGAPVVQDPQRFCDVVADPIEHPELQQQMLQQQQQQQENVRGVRKPVAAYYSRDEALVVLRNHLDRFSDACLLPPQGSSSLPISGAEIVPFRILCRPTNWQCDAAKVLLSDFMRVTQQQQLQHHHSEHHHEANRRQEQNRGSVFIPLLTPALRSLAKVCCTAEFEQRLWQVQQQQRLEFSSDKSSAARRQQILGEFFLSCVWQRPMTSASAASANGESVTPNADVLSSASSTFHFFAETTGATGHAKNRGAPSFAALSCARCLSQINVDPGALPQSVRKRLGRQLQLLHHSGQQEEQQQQQQQNTCSDDDDHGDSSLSTSPKLAVCVELLRFLKSSSSNGNSNNEKKKKVVVFAHAVRGLAVLREHLAKQQHDGSDELVYVASVADALRQQQVISQAFSCNDPADLDEDDDSVRPWLILASVHAAVSASLNLSRCTAVVFLDSQWDPLAEYQALARVRRIITSSVAGSSSEVFRLSCPQSIDEVFADSNRRRLALAELAISGHVQVSAAAPSPSASALPLRSPSRGGIAQSRAAAIHSGLSELLSSNRRGVLLGVK